MEDPHQKWQPVRSAQLKALYLQEGDTDGIVFTALETLREELFSNGHKHHHGTVFNPYPSKLKRRLSRAKILRKQGVMSTNTLCFPWTASIEILLILLYVQHPQRRSTLLRTCVMISKALDINDHVEVKHYHQGEVMLFAGSRRQPYSDLDLQISNSESDSSLKQILVVDPSLTESGFDTDLESDSDYLKFGSDTECESDFDSDSSHLSLNVSDSLYLSLQI